ncbi:MULTISPECIES: ABC transporter ATP-binding protein [Phyllobacteriaceae]|uniref:ABC transporter ATP-binding protein n=1 Tax=Mesorhizobium hungaricum TaxID=1566387 RepID=A0A1C2EES9_9HYPH|nr:MULTISPECIES: ABC transporter ATP-binding protein [Mesorhizobium]MDQ0327682.1 branched-chain amino acid transport system ATP-binding protein [Mesorhizobium sp. YL-MeA3-2017]OCX25341.1 ABC transporter ATP-binding protein [Mesorhizobium hungaricum]
MNALLEVENATMRFGGLVALNDISFSVGRGEVLAVIGPNGAGKSTLFNVVTGVYRPTSGRVRFDGSDITGHPAHDVVARGVGRTFQTSRLFSDLSVLDNVIIGMHTRTGTGVLGALFLPGASRREMAACVEKAEALLKAGSGDLFEQRYRLAGTLAQADRRRLEIARALASEPKLLLLDEPSVGMDEIETDALIADIARLKRERADLSVILIEHDMRVVEAFPHQVICIDYGSKIAEGDFAAVKADPRVQEAYLGKAAVHA